MKGCRQRQRRCRRPDAAGGFVAAALGLLVLSTLTATAQAGETVEVQGNRRTDAATVRSYFHAAPDGRFDTAARDAALKALLATGLFEDVRIDGAGDRLVVHVAEAPVLDRVAFEGNKKVQDKHLMAVVASKARGTLQRSVVQADVGRIIEAFFLLRFPSIK